MIPIPTTKEVVMKFMGVSPKQLPKIHEWLETLEHEENLNPEQKCHKGEHVPPEYKPWARLVRSDFSKEHSSYLVEISIHTRLDCFSQDKCNGLKYELARLEMLGKLFDVLGIFPDTPRSVYSGRIDL